LNFKISFIYILLFTVIWPLGVSLVRSVNCIIEYLILITTNWSCCSFTLYRNKAMRAAAFSADGSVLAVAADTVITLWDPDKNELVAVVGETPSVSFWTLIMSLYLCVCAFLHTGIFQTCSISTNKTCMLLTQMLVKVHLLLLVWLVCGVFMKIMAAIGGSKAYIYLIFILQHALKHQTQDYKNNKKESMAHKKKFPCYIFRMHAYKCCFGFCILGFLKLYLYSSLLV